MRTAKEMLFEAFTYPLGKGENTVTLEIQIMQEKLVRVMESYADQQTAALKKEVEELKDLKVLKDFAEKASVFNHAKWKESEEKIKSLESIVDAQISAISKQLSEIARLREAIQFAMNIKELWNANYKLVLPEHEGEQQALTEMENKFKLVIQQ